MTAIPLKLPTGSIVTGEILRDYTRWPRRLNEDMLQVVLPNRLTIDVGWVPACDTNGEFQIAVYDENWDSNIIPPIFVKTPFEAANLVQELAEVHSKASMTITRETQTFSETIHSISGGGLKLAYAG